MGEWVNGKWYSRVVESSHKCKSCGHPISPRQAAIDALKRLDNRVNMMANREDLDIVSAYVNSLS